MDAPARDPGAIRANGWRQGSLLMPSDLPHDTLASLNLPEQALLYVLAHDCDLVQPDFEKEPSVELLVIVPIDTPDGNHAHGKNSRIIDFDTGAGTFRAVCHSRFTLPRWILCTVKPADLPPVDEYTRDMISQWISKRYIRPAFPDTFNRRLAAQKKQIQKFLKNHGARFWQILVACNPSHEELPDGDPYELLVWLVESPDFDASAASVTSSSLANDFANILKQCPSINLEECRVVTEDDVTLGHTRLFSEWDFDYLTHREALQPA